MPENIKMRNQNFKRMYEKYGEAAKRGLGIGPAYECADVPYERYVDRYNTLLAIKAMKQMGADKSKPFFLAMGYKLPHLNWIASTKYWVMYEPKEIPLAMSRKC